MLSKLLKKYYETSENSITRSWLFDQQSKTNKFDPKMGMREAANPHFENAKTRNVRYFYLINDQPPKWFSVNFHIDGLLDSSANYFGADVIYQTAFCGLQRERGGGCNPTPGLGRTVALLKFYQLKHITKIFSIIYCEVFAAISKKNTTICRATTVSASIHSLARLS